MLVGGRRGAPLGMQFGVCLRQFTQYCMHDTPREATPPQRPVLQQEVQDFHFLSTFLFPNSY
jgi:hypothetical protein